MSWTTDRLPISRINAVVVAAFLAGGVLTLALGYPGQGVALLAGGLGGLGCALWGRRPQARDVTRLNALEWRDERDRRLGRDALSAVGAAALLLSVLELVLVSALAPEALFLAWLQLIALTVVWGIANSVVVRRG